MPLVAQALRREHLDRLDLETFALGEDGVAAPRAVSVLAHPAILPSRRRACPAGRRSHGWRMLGTHSPDRWEGITMRFRDRSDAGRRLASRLQFLRNEDVVVLGLPRGGVPVAAEVARALGAPLDVILVRKLGVPAQPELGLGAIGESEARVINPEVVRYAHVSEAEIAQVERRERAELQRRAQRFRGDAPHEPLAGRTAVIVDDGIATGSTARAACQVARALGAAAVVLAAPVAPPSVDKTLRGDADEVICLEMPERFLAIGEWYEDFSQTSDEEVVALLRAAQAGPVRGRVAGLA